MLDYYDYRQCSVPREQHKKRHRAKQGQKAVKSQSKHGRKLRENIKTKTEVREQRPG